MWWRGKLATVKKQLSSWAFAGQKAPPVARASDLFALLRLKSIMVRDADKQPPTTTAINPFTKQVIKLKGTARLRRPVAAHFEFHAAFDEDHGVAILTDGQKVLGTGYSGEVEPFKAS